MDETKYIVINGNTLGYTQHGMKLVGVLAGKVLKGGHDPMNGPISISETDALRAATIEDFNDFRVDAKGHIR